MLAQSRRLTFEPAVTDAGERDALFKRVWKVCQEDARTLSEKELTFACYWAVETARVLDNEAARRRGPLTEDELVDQLSRELTNNFTLHADLPLEVARRVLRCTLKNLTPSAGQVTDSRAEPPKGPL